jgi:multiple sugar transport system permease protein
MWVWLFNPQLGLINNLLLGIGIEGPLWLQSTEWALPTLILMSLWRAGGHMVIYLAALQGVPSQLYEAAAIDGATAVHRFRHVTLPMITPVLLFELVMGVIGSFQVFTQAFIATGGGPARSTLFYVLYLFDTAFHYFEMGYASALAWVLFLVILACTLLILRNSNRWVHYESSPR